MNNHNKIIQAIRALGNDSNNQKWMIVEAYIQQLLNNLLNVSDNAEIDAIFKNLDTIQVELAKKIYKEDMRLPSHLIQFVSDFDRIDDLEVKKNIINKVRKGEYLPL